jgi:hypothetical protein
LSSSALVRAVTAVGSSGSGIVHGSISADDAGVESVSPVSARVRRATATMSPAVPVVTGVSVPPSGRETAPTRSSMSWSGCPRSAPAKRSMWPETWTTSSCASRPEKIRTSDSRPT